MNKYKFIAVILAAFLAGCSGGNSGEITSSETLSASSGTTASEAEITFAETTAKLDYDLFQGDALGNLHKFSAATIDGGSFTEADFADRDITIINFWATTCPPCIREMPELAGLQKSLPDNIALITCCLDGNYDPQGAQNILSTTGFDGVTIAAADGDFIDLCDNLMYTPTTLFFDSEGNALGGAVIGSPKDVKSYYIAVINSLLTQMGKEEITIE